MYIAFAYIVMIFFCMDDLVSGDWGFHTILIMLLAPITFPIMLGIKFRDL